MWMGIQFACSFLPFLHIQALLSFLPSFCACPLVLARGFVSPLLGRSASATPVGSHQLPISNKKMKVGNENTENRRFRYAHIKLKKISKAKRAM